MKTSAKYCLILIFLLTIPVSTYADILREQNDQNAAATGMSLSGLDDIATEFEAILNDSNLPTPGAQLAIFKNGLFIMALAGGVTQESGETPVEHDTLFQYRSVTKTLAAIGDMVLWDDGSYDVNDLVTQYWTGYSANGKQNTTLLMVLGHREGIPQGLALYAGQYEMNTTNRANIVAQIEGLTPLWTPGNANGYHASNSGYVMDEIALREDGRDTAQVFLQDVLAPSGIANLWIGLPSSEYPNMAHMWVEDSVRSAQPQRAAFSDYLNTQQGIGERISWVAGCGTAKALAEVGQILAGKGTYNGVTYYSQAAHNLFATPTNASGVTDLILGYEVRWGLAFMLGDTPVVFGDESHPNAIGHLGGSATVLQADPVTGLSYVYLSNSMLDTEASNERYQRIGNAVWAAVTNQPPAFTRDPIKKANAIQNKAYHRSIAGHAGDPYNDPLTFSKMSGPSWLNLASDGNLSGTPAPGDLGVNQWTIRVSDGELYDDATLQITVTENSGYLTIPLIFLLM